METNEEVDELERTLKSSNYKPIESPLKLFKDKDGNKLTTKEFFSRWKSGIQNLTPIQKLTNETRGTFITLIGSVVCLIALIVYRDRFFVNWFAYGLILIFLGNIITTGLKWLSMKQQLKFFKDTESKAISLDDMFDKLDNLEGEPVILDNKNKFLEGDNE